MAEEERGIIDFHTHLLKRELINPTTAEFLRQVNPDYLDRMEEFARRPDLFSEYLESQGVRWAVVLPEYAPATSAFIPTEEVVKFCQGQERLIPFASLNPNAHTDPAGQLEHFVKDMGVKGLKLLPSYQFFYPNEARLYPLYAQAQELGVPIIFHIGSSVFKGTKIKYCDPIHLDEVAVDFPRLKIVMAHSGRGFWYDQCFFLSRLHPNVYMDLTGLPPANLLKYFPDLDKNGRKVIFGSDWPAVPAGIRANVEAIKSLGLSENTLEAVFYQNAYEMLFSLTG